MDLDPLYSLIVAFYSRLNLVIEEYSDHSARERVYLFLLIVLIILAMSLNLSFLNGLASLCSLVAVFYDRLEIVIEGNTVHPARERIYLFLLIVLSVLVMSSNLALVMVLNYFCSLIIAFCNLLNSISEKKSEQHVKEKLYLTLIIILLFGVEAHCDFNQLVNLMYLLDDIFQIGTQLKII